MLRLIGLVISIGLADSLNPSTIGPALYMATGERALGRVTEFTLGVFAVYFLGGAAIALGPGQLLLSLVPHPHPNTRHVLEIIAGAAMLVASGMLWRFRDRLTRREPPDFDPHGKASAILGATITAVELPTAFPYFAVIAAIVGSGLDPIRQLILLVMFNFFFVLPMLAIIATLAFAGDRAEQVLATGRNFLQRHWPSILAGLALVAGVFVIVLGATGLGSTRRGDLGIFSRRLRRLLQLHH
ncbi:MAG: GAP family protein [Solirubrobacteraceae bacterium]